MNLASVARFDKAGCRIVFERGMGAYTLVEATLTNDPYIFDMRDTMRYQKAMLSSSAPKEDLILWHRRIGHRNKRDILAVVNKDLITGISKTAVARDKSAPICDCCTKAKCTRTLFHRDG